MFNQKRISSFASIIRVLALRGLGVLMSLFTMSGLAFFFGAGPLLDAFFFVRRTFGSLTGLVESLFTLLLVPKYVKDAQDTSARDHLQRVGRLEIRCFILGALLAVLMIFFVDELVAYLAPGLNDAGAEATAFFMVLMSLTLPITISTGVTAAALSAIRQFSLPVAVRLLPRLLILLAIFLVPIGLNMTGVVLAAVAGHVVMGIVLWISKRRLIRVLSPAVATDPAPRVKASKATPDRGVAFTILALYSLIATLSESYFASLVGVGAIAVLSLGQRLSTMGTSEILGSLLSVYYTNFSEVSGDKPGLHTEINSALRTGFFFIVPLCFLLIILGDRVADIVLANGAFTSAAAKSASTLITLFALAGLVNTFSSVFEAAVLALPSDQKTRHFLIASVMALALRIAFLLAFISQLGLLAIGVAAIIGPLVFAVMNFAYVRRYAGPPIDRTLMADLGAIAVSGAFLAVVAVAVPMLLPEAGGKAWDIVGLVLAGGLSGAAYLIVATMMKLEDARKITSKLGLRFG